MSDIFELVDNAVMADGKHKDFTILQNKTKALLMQDEHAYFCYGYLQGVGANYNVTLRNIARSLKWSDKTAAKALEKLKKLKLLKQEADKDITGEKSLQTASGKSVPNNRQRYKLYAVPYDGITHTKAEQAATIPFDLDADALMNFRQVVSVDNTPPNMQPQKPAVAQSQVQEKTPPKEQTAPQTAYNADSNGRYKPLFRKANSTAGSMEERQRQLDRIAQEQLLFSSVGKEKLKAWAQKYYQQVGKAADENALQVMANLLSGNAKADLSGFIQQEKRKFAGK